MRWAITPRGIGQPVAWRAIPEGAELAPGEFESTTDPDGKVLADDGASLRSPTSAELLQRARDQKLAELVEIRDAAILSPCTWNAEQWSAAAVDQANLIQTVALWDVVRRADPELLAELAADGAIVPQSAPWKTIANDVRDLTFNQSVRLAAAMSLPKLTCFGMYWGLEAAVTAAPTIEAVNAIAWPGGQ